MSLLHYRVDGRHRLEGAESQAACKRISRMCRDSLSIMLELPRTLPILQHTRHVLQARQMFLGDICL